MIVEEKVVRHQSTDLAPDPLTDIVVLVVTGTETAVIVPMVPDRGHHPTTSRPVDHLAHQIASTVNVSRTSSAVM